MDSHFNETVDKFDFGMDDADILKVDDDPAPREIAYPIIKEKIKQSKKADVSITCNTFSTIINKRAEEHTQMTWFSDSGRSQENRRFS